MLDLTVIILTFNEAKHLQRCLNSVAQIAKTIIVVDSGSTDQTCEIARRFGARIYYHSFKHQAAQLQWALLSCPIHTQWVLRLDADEYIEIELNQEIQQRLPNLAPEIHGIFLKRKQYFLGKWIRYGNRYPLILLRLWRHQSVILEQRWMDEHILLIEGQGIIFEHHFIDDNQQDIFAFIQKHQHYANREMLDLINQKYQLELSHFYINNLTDQQIKTQRILKQNYYNKSPLFIRAILYFIYRYFIKLGFLDGWIGLLYHFIQGFYYRCLVDIQYFKAAWRLRYLPQKKAKIIYLIQLTGLPVEGSDE
ncbi:MAG: hypothetical protein RL637_1235 [Pseudomonadota bacterium]|jgi:glycosyltransferase involved in cell wall biosynthesis